LSVRRLKRIRCNAIPAPIILTKATKVSSYWNRVIKYPPSLQKRLWLGLVDTTIANLDEVVTNTNDSGIGYRRSVVLNPLLQTTIALHGLQTSSGIGPDAILQFKLLPVCNDRLRQRTTLDVVAAAGPVQLS
jgi:hypothetical protein